ncbi:MAG: hypothetical protein ACYCQJ_12925 [Nitrososphaerales archaeon]
MSNRDQLPIRFIGIVVGGFVSSIILGLLGANNLASSWGLPLLIIDVLVFGIGGVIIGYREHVKYLGFPAYSPALADPKDHSKERGELWIEHGIYEIKESLFAEILLKIEDWKGIDLLKELYKQINGKDIEVSEEVLKEQLVKYGVQVAKNDEENKGANDIERNKQNAESLKKLLALNQVISSVWPLKDQEGKEIHAFFQKIRDSELLNGEKNRNQIIFTHKADWRNQFAWTAMRGAESVYKGNWLYAMDYTLCSVAALHVVKMRPEVVETKYLHFFKRTEEISRDVPMFLLWDSHQLRQEATDNFRNAFSKHVVTPKPSTVEALAQVSQILAQADLVEENMQLRKERDGWKDMFYEKEGHIMETGNGTKQPRGFKLTMPLASVIIAGIALLGLILYLRV